MAQKRRFNSIRSQIVFYVSAFVVLFAVAIAGVLYHVLSSYILASQKAENEAFAFRVAANCDGLLSQLESLMSSVVYNPSVAQALEGYGEFSHYQKLEAFQQIRQLIGGMVMEKRDVVGAYVYSPAGAYYYFEKGGHIDRHSPMFLWLDRQASSTPGNRVFYSHLYRPDYLSPNNEAQVFSLATPVLAVDVGKPRQVGTMVVNIGADFFERATEQQMRSQKYQVEIIGGDGQQIFATHWQHSADRHRYPSLPQPGTYVTAQAITTVSSSQIGEWRYVVHNDLSDLRRSQQSVLQVIVVMIVAGIVLTIVIAAVITSQATRSVGALSRLMAKVQQGDLHARLEQQSSCREMDVLFWGLEAMMDRINDLIEENYLKEIREQQAKLDSLQSQISPHFLNNTLQTITSLAILQRNKDIEFVSAKLADFFAYVVYQPTTITLGQELEYIETYLAIQNVRYNNKFQLSLDIEPQWLAHPLSKLLLQPLAENAVIHGFIHQADHCLLCISAGWAKGNFLRIVVADTGAGIAPDRLRDINLQLASRRPPVAGRSIGLDNINQRLHILYGERSCMRLQSRLGEGTRVTIDIPLSQHRDREGEAAC